jgi:hypothetical protein
MVTGSDHVHAKVEQFFRNYRRQAESTSSIFTVHYKQVDLLTRHKRREMFPNDASTGMSEYVTNK